MEERRFHEEDFLYFLGELVDGDRIEESKEKGIAKLAIDKGYDFLSDKQKYVLSIGISNFLFDNCERCATSIPWVEMYAAEDNGGLCNYCWHMKEKYDRD